MGSKLLKGGIKTLILKVVNIGVLFLVSVALAQALGAEEYGKYIFIFSLVSLISESMFVSLRVVALRNTAIYLHENSLGLLRGLTIRLKHFMLAGAGLSALVLIGTVWLMSFNNSSYSGWLIVTAALLPFILGLNRIRDGILRGAGSVMASQIPKLVVRPLMLLIFIILGWFILEQKLNATWAMTFQLAAALCAGCLYFLYFQRRLRKKLTAPAEYRSTEWFRSIIPVFASAAVYSLDARMGVLIVGVMLSSSDTGAYHAAFRLAELIVLAQAAAIVVIEPQAARLYHANAQNELQRKITITARLVFVLSLPVAVIMMFFGDLFLALFGSEFKSAAPVLAVLAASQLVNAAFGFPAMLLTMSNKSGEALKGFMIGAIVNLGLSLMLVPKMGIAGAAWAALASMTVTQIILMLRVRHKLRLNSSIFHYRLSASLQ